MNHSLIEIIMLALIVGYVFMSVVFIAHQIQGKNFIASFDKAVRWGGYLFVAGSGLGTAVHLT